MTGELHTHHSQDPADGGTVQQTIVLLLHRISKRWAEFDHDMLSETETKALYLLVSAGMVERRIRFRVRMHNHAVAVEGTFTATGEYGTIEALKRVSAAMWGEWQDSLNAWRTSGTGSEPPLFFERLKPDEWRLTDQGVIAHDDLDGSGAAVVIDFVLRRGFFDGQPRLVNGKWKCREPVRGSGTLLSMRKVPADAIPDIGVNIQNWTEGATAFANAFWESATPNVNPGQEVIGGGPASNASDSSEASRRPADEEPQKAKSRRGRKEDSDPKADKRIAEAWSTGNFKTYADLERELNLTAGEVKRALDRHRKRK